MSDWSRTNASPEKTEWQPDTQSRAHKTHSDRAPALQSGECSPCSNADTAFLSFERNASVSVRLVETRFLIKTQKNAPTAITVTTANGMPTAKPRLVLEPRPEERIEDDTVAVLEAVVGELAAVELVSAKLAVLVARISTESALATSASSLEAAPLEAAPLEVALVVTVL